METPGPRSLRIPHPSRLAPDDPNRSEIIRRHDDALEQRDAGYTDPRTGNFVFSAAYLAARGYCCDTGCRHCPYLG